MGVAEIILSIEIELDPEDKQYVARCNELGTSTCGDTLDEARDNIAEAIQVHLEALEATGDLERVLSDAGVEITATPTLALMPWGMPENVPLMQPWARKMEGAVRVPVHA